MKPLVIHHDDADGIVAALAVERHVQLRNAADEVEFHATNYGKTPPDVTGRDVFIVDFSYPRAALLALQEGAASLRVFDHHKSAQEDLAGLDFCTFDMNRSGAGLVWDELVPEPRPWLVDYVEDADLWRFKLFGSRGIRAAMSSYPQTVEQFREWFLVDVFSWLLDDGRAILRYQDHLVEEAAKLATTGVFWTPAGNMLAKVLPMPIRALISVVAGRLAEESPFGASYYYDPEAGVYRFSLRSRADGCDVSEIAKLYGGGGHRHAAGFSVTAEEAIDMVGI
jgi:oligoribonuclease NrnB/cAMP/cGMP phosphodiesterase (DHH superfamily)